MMSLVIKIFLPHEQSFLTPQQTILAKLLTKPAASTMIAFDHLKLSSSTAVLNLNFFQW